MVYTTADQDARTPTAFPAGLDVHWETDSWVMWNEQERVEIGTLKARLFRAQQKLRVLLTRSPEFRGARTMSKTRQHRDGGLNSHPAAEGATSRGSRTAGSKARAATSLGWGWRKGTRERASESNEVRMLEVA